MAKQVLDIRAGKGMTTSQSNEFLRNANGGERLKRWSGNYDSTREHLNFEIKKSENEQLSQTIEGQLTVIREQRATLSGLEKDIKHATARFKALQTMIANLESVSAKACCLMHTVAADCSLWSTDVNGANGGISAFLSNFKVVGI